MGAPLARRLRRGALTLPIIGDRVERALLGGAFGVR